MHQHMREPLKKTFFQTYLSLGIEKDISMFTLTIWLGKLSYISNMRSLLISWTGIVLQFENDPYSE